MQIFTAFFNLDSGYVPLHCSVTIYLELVISKCSNSNLNGQNADSKYCVVLLPTITKSCSERHHRTWSLATTCLTPSFQPASTACIRHILTLCIVHTVLANVYGLFNYLGASQLYFSFYCSSMVPKRKLIVTAISFLYIHELIRIHVGLMEMWLKPWGSCI